jgi:TPR repeat protein
MSDVFVSYARDDRARVEQLAKALEARGFDVWWDPELLPGEQYAQKITRVLADCKAVIVVWSKASAARPWVLDEASVGRDRGVLIPVMIEPTEAPLGFRQLQAEDLTHWPTGSEDRFERVVRALESLRGSPAAPKPHNAFPTQPPPKPAGQFGFLRPDDHAAAHHPGEAAAAVKPNRLWIYAGVAALAVLGVIAYQQIGGKGAGGATGITGVAPPPGETEGAGTIYGLTDKEYASMPGHALIKLALQRSTFDKIRIGADSGDPKAQALTCLAYDWGEGVSADSAMARSWCEKASANGAPLATFLLNYYYRNGSGGLTVDPAKSSEFLEKAANDGDARAQFDLGTNYLNGQNGYQINDTTALSWYRKSAQQGYEDSQFNLAWMYENGRGAPKDYATALLWYQKLADQGSAIGVRAVGWMNYNGWGTDKNLTRAAELYKKASEMGDGNASRNMAKLYENGEGVDKDLDEAVKYYRTASSQGFKQADDDLKRLGFK